MSNRGRLGRSRRHPGGAAPTASRSADPLEDLTAPGHHHLALGQGLPGLVGQRDAGRKHHVLVLGRDLQAFGLKSRSVDGARSAKQVQPWRPRLLLIVVLALMSVEEECCTWRRAHTSAPILPWLSYRPSGAGKGWNNRGQVFSEAGPGPATRSSIFAGPLPRPAASLSAGRGSRRLPDTGGVFRGSG